LDLTFEVERHENRRLPFGRDLHAVLGRVNDGFIVFGEQGALLVVKTVIIMLIGAADWRRGGVRVVVLIVVVIVVFG
jgi:hypothetical protein